MSTLHSDPRFEPNELLSEAAHSSERTVFVEGSNDAFWYDRIQMEKGVHFQAVGDKSRVLALCEAIKDYQGDKSRFVCLVDKDLWVLFGVPDDVKYDCLLTTHGYSIENDILNGSCVDNLFEEDEKLLFEKYKDALSRWFAFQASYNNTHTDRLHEYPALESVLCSYGHEPALNIQYLVRELGYVEPVSSAIAVVRNDFAKVFRGKHLLHLYALLFSLRNTAVKPKFSAKQIVEIALKATSDSTLKSVTLKKIQDAFASFDSALNKA